MVERLVIPAELSSAENTKLLSTVVFGKIVNVIKVIECR